MSIRDEYHNSMVTINIGEHFTFNDSNLFRETLNKAFSNKITTLNINLSRLDFMDSSGLGMLMVADNECKKHHVSLQLRNPVGEVKKLLQLTRCYERFNVLEH